MTIGRILPWTLCGAGPRETLGIPVELRDNGWEWFCAQYLAPKLLTHFGGAAPAGTRFLIHQPFGCSPDAVAGLGDMRFNNRRKCADLYPDVADERQFRRGVRALQAATGVGVDIYLGTTEAGHKQEWDDMNPEQLTGEALYAAGWVRKLAGCRVVFDVAGVCGPETSSWMVAQTLRRWGIAVGCEPWIAKAAAQWNTADVGCYVTRQAIASRLDGSGWAVPDASMLARVGILWNTATPVPADDPEIYGYIAKGWDVYVPFAFGTRTAAQWQAAMSVQATGQ